MSAFQPYSGDYESGGRTYQWRCYATARVHQVRTSNFSQLPRAPAGARWVFRSRREGEPLVAWLVDETVRDFSYMLLQHHGEASASLASAEPRSFAEAV